MSRNGFATAFEQRGQAINEKVRLYGLPAAIGDTLFLVAALVFLLFFAALVIKLVFAPRLSWLT
jgi:hypothetical protein